MVSSIWSEWWLKKYCNSREHKRKMRLLISRSWKRIFERDFYYLQMVKDFPTFNEFFFVLDIYFQSSSANFNCEIIIHARCYKKLIFNYSCWFYLSNYEKGNLILLTYIALLHINFTNFFLYAVRITAHTINIVH